MPSRMKFLQYKMFKGHKPVAMSLFHLQERGVRRMKAENLTLAEYVAKGGTAE